MIDGREMIRSFLVLFSEGGEGAYRMFSPLSVCDQANELAREETRPSGPKPPLPLL